MATAVANASISITGNGNTNVNGTLTWTKPSSIPADAVISDITVSCNMYTWTGKGNFTLTINGSSYASGAGFSKALPTSATSPYTITGRGGNKNATGANCSFTNLVVTYTYTSASQPDEILYAVENGQLVKITKAYKVINGTLVELTDLTSVFEEGVNYVRI